MISFIKDFFQTVRLCDIDLERMLIRTNRNSSLCLECHKIPAAVGNIWILKSICKASNHIKRVPILFCYSRLQHFRDVSTKYSLSFIIILLKEKNGELYVRALDFVFADKITKDWISNGLFRVVLGVVQFSACKKCNQRYSVSKILLLCNAIVV